MRRIGLLVFATCAGCVLVTAMLLFSYQRAEAQTSGSCGAGCFAPSARYGSQLMPVDVTVRWDGDKYSWEIKYDARRVSSEVVGKVDAELRKELHNE